MAAPRDRDQAVERVDLLLLETGDVFGDHRAEQHATEGRATRREVAVVHRHPARRHVPSRVPDVQFGEQHGETLRQVFAHRWDGASGERRRASQIASMMALKRALGRIAAVTSSSSGW